MNSKSSFEKLRMTLTWSIYFWEFGGNVMLGGVEA
jgi:hypothetical protein